jgi:hypothetical protein
VIRAVLGPDVPRSMARTYLSVSFFIVYLRYPCSVYHAKASSTISLSDRMR